MSQFPNTKGQKTMAESDPVVLPSDQIISVDSNGEYLATELTVSSILSAVQQQSDYETKLVVDSLDVTYLEVRTWNSSTGTFNPPTYYLPNSNTPATPTPPLAYINPNTYLSLIVSNTTDINLEDTQQLVLTAVTNSELLLNNINNKLVNGTDIGDVTINNGAGVSAVNIQDGGNSITIDGTVTTVPSGIQNVNIVSGITLEVNLDQNNDQVQIYGSDLTTPILTDSFGRLQVDIVSIPEVEIKNDIDNPIPVFINTSGGSLSISGTVGLDIATLSALENITIQNGGGVAAVNIQDGGNVISIDDAGGSLTVDANNLDIRDLTFATDKVDVGGSVIALDSATLTALESITIQNGSGAAAVNIQDGGNSITVDATDLDIRNLTFATDKVDVSNSTVGLDAATLSALENITVQNGSGAAAVNIQDGGNSITVDANNLDIRDLVFATDKVDVGGSVVGLDVTTLTALENITVQNGSGASAVNIQDGGNSITVDATDLDIRNLTFVTDKVDVTDSIVGLDATTLSALESITVQNGGGAAAVNIQDGGNSITVDGGTGFQRTPNFLRPSGVSGTISAGAYSVSISSVGTANATVGGITLKPGETLNFEGGGINNTIGAIAYNTTTPGAELIIISLT